jgi:glycosyltransferase involved in cell wall biosynthesis/frataxin-like iron-binding protein CyaY
MGSIRKQQANRPAPKVTPRKETGLKILQIVDSPHSAIRTLANQIVRHTRDKATIETVVFHPKRPDKAQLDQIQQLWLWCDMVDVQYWKSGAKIRELFPKLWDRRKKILTHYNPYNLHEEKWEDYEVVNVVNGFQKKELPNARMMPLAIDMDFFAFNRSNYTLDPTVNMSVSRIEGKKGVVEVAKACNELGYKLLLVGRVSDANYIEQVKAAGGKALEFRNNVSDSEVRKAYYESAIHVCNSVDNFESGCYDNQTEILTDQGWKLFSDLNKTEKVATLNPETNKLEYHKPYKYIEQEGHKELYCVENRSVSFAVTANHNMWVSSRTTGKNRLPLSKPYRFVRADKLPSNFKIQRTCDWQGETNKPVNWFRFMGIYLAEGSLDHCSKNYYRIHITAYKKRIRQLIEELLDDMNFDYEINKSGFRIKGENELALYLKTFGNAPYKYVPEEILNAQSEMIEEFLTWFAYGDGGIWNGARKFYTSSKKLADNIQECLFKIGKSGNISIRDRRGEKRFIQDHWAVCNELEYTIYERVKKCESYIRRDMDISIKPYDGKVYCVEVKNHILLIRRNGKPMFCGNTMPILEAMACGTPVLTRKVGHVPDIYNGSNMRLNEASCEDVESIKAHLKEMMDGRNYRIGIRNVARESIADRNDKKRAELYLDLYREVLKK